MNNIINFIYPKRCPGCDGVLRNENQRFCKACMDKIYYIKGDYCLKCGKPVEGSSASYCHDCSKQKRSFEQSRSVYLYKGAMKMAMYRFKYSNRRCYGRSFMADMMMLQGEWLRNLGVECVIPIPMFIGKQKLRGYNQATVLARELSQALGVPVRENILFRCKSTQPMKNLNPIQRRINLENAFICKGYSVKYTKVLLVDDIFTTGATFDMAAQVLKRYGVRQVFCVSVCIGWGS